MKRITSDWLISAESDLQLIDEIILKENLTHLSAFHAQQSVEKSFKAVIEEFDLGVKKTHSLEMLFSKVKEKVVLNLEKDILILLDQLYIDARYPGELGLLPEGKPNLKEAQIFFDFAKDVYRAIKKELESKV
jgi:HEPN domain-containing protein